ncbi:MAG: stage IV sporulation protein A [Clostridiales bacterium]|nr:stage IV sporulation protein A [Clostridiales bacterium]
MAESRIYEDIALRTGGDIYVGVVGPVRTGKSTFIKRFMETLVIPNIENTYAKERARDELPQSGSGRTVMTAEPKFVPEDAVKIRIEDKAELSVRLIDCVGYMVPGAAGMMEEETERMVTTPWYDHEISFTMAAEEGTRRVIRDHSTIGLVVTTDGSICGIDRENYVEAEERVIAELCEIGKPFVILLNCQQPNSQAAKELAADLGDKYGVSCVSMNCLDIDEGDIEKIFYELLSEFPVEEYSVYLPQWVEALPSSHSIKKKLFEEFTKESNYVYRLRQAEQLAKNLCEVEDIGESVVSAMELGTGSFSLKVELPRSLYYETISEESGLEIKNDGDLILMLCELARVKAEYDRVAVALEDVHEKGYGVVMPTAEEMVLQEPEIVRQGGKYSVILRAGAPAIHMLKTNVETEVSPAVGGENASQEILGFLLQNFEGDASKIWESNIFGKSMYDIAGEGLNAKLKPVPEETGQKLRGALQRIIN